MSRSDRNFVVYALAVGTYGLLTFLVLFFAMRQRRKPEVQEDLEPIAVRGADAVLAALRQEVEPMPSRMNGLDRRRPGTLAWQGSLPESEPPK